MKTLIKLENSHYQVRRIGELRQVRIGKKWIRGEDFPDWLAENEKWGELAELVRYGVARLRSES
jgi:hypothetical protein